MKNTNAWAALLGTILCAQANAQTIPASDFTRRPEVYEVSLSPTGEYVAMAIPSADGLETQLHIVKLDGSDKTQILRFGPQQHVADVTWTADEQVVVSRARNEPLQPRPYSYGQLITSDIHGKNQDTLFGYVRDSTQATARRKDEGFASINRVLDEEPGMALVSFQCWNCGEEPDTVIYRVDTRTGNRKEYERADKPAGFVFDRKGTPRIKVTSDTKDDPVLEYRPAPGSTWQPLPKSLAGYSVGNGRFMEDNNTLYLAVSDAGEPEQLYKVDLAAGTRTKVAGREDSEMAYFEYGGRNGVPFAVIYNAGKPSVQYIDPTSEWAKLHAGLMKAFPGELLDFEEFSRDNNKVLFTVWSDRHPAAYYVFDRTTKQAQLIAESRSWIKPEQMATTQSFEYGSRDGRKLYGFYTAKGSGAKPLIVLPHGGPHGPYDSWGYDADAQFFASRGYGVLQVNFRGSGGRGHNFETAGYREWGGRMQDDIADGVRWAIDKKLADPSRICTYGASFGGYAALMQPIRYPELYKCAVGYVGVYDLTVMQKAGDIPETRFGRRYLDRVIGSDHAVLIANSPARNVDKIKIPVFLAGGSIDRRVPMDQFNALKNAFPSSTTVETMVAQGEGHGFYKPENQAELYRRVEVFLGKNIGAQGK